MHSLAALAAATLAIGGSTASVPSFPGAFVRHPAIPTSTAEHECLSLGDDLFDNDVAQIGACRAFGLQPVGSAGQLSWTYGVYERRWLLAPADTVVEREVVLFTNTTSREPASLQPVWHYRYETQLLASVTPEVVGAAGGAVLLSIRECVNGTGGCDQSFALLRRGAPTVVKLAFLDSLNRRFPDGIRHGFHVDLATLQGSLGLYSGNDANCCPSKIGEFSLRLRGSSLEIATLKLRRAD